MPPIQPRQKLEYKRPKRINPVSVTLTLVLGAVVYVAYSLWPVYMLRTNVLNEMHDGLPTLWRMNLRPDEVAIPELTKLKQSLLDRMRAAGVKDKKLTVKLERGKKAVAIEARFTATAVFPWWEKKLDFPMKPRVETDAGRVEW